jgi:hypothetical protein
MDNLICLGQGWCGTYGVQGDIFARPREAVDTEARSVMAWGIET